MNESRQTWVMDVNQENFERDVIEGSRERPVVVDFWAPWCGPCRMLAPMLERLAEERAGAFLLAKVNIDEAPQIADQYAIESIPAVKAFRDGQVILEFVGLLPEHQLRDFLHRICPTEADGLARQANELEAQNPAEAETLYRRALDLDRNQEAAVVGLARLLLARHQEDEAAELLKRMGPGSEYGSEAERLESVLDLRRLRRDLPDEPLARQRLKAEPNNAAYRYELGCILAAEGHYQEALDLLLTAAQADRQLAASKVRETMVKIFQIVGVRSELADTYRDRLSKLLY